jgi:NFU1 iron-sulfur cluster scaffold homolog, mitochondrial
MAEVVLVSTTPNPNAMKFTVDVVFDEMFNVTSADDAADIPVAKAIFDAGGVASVFATADFMTVGRTDDADWGPIEQAVRTAVAAHL